MLFDKFRRIRNKINYYGRDLSPKEAEAFKEEIAELLEKLKKLF